MRSACLFQELPQGLFRFAGFDGLHGLHGYLELLERGCIGLFTGSHFGMRIPVSMSAVASRSELGLTPSRVP
jgi:hypothetical protein